MVDLVGATYLMSLKYDIATCDLDKLSAWLSPFFCLLSGLVILKTNERKFIQLENLYKVVKFDKKSGRYFV